jgi:quinoprotein glucose dehydrogenase
MTSASAVIDDLVVVGSAIDDNQRIAMPAGVVRAFDVRTGALRLSWDPIPVSKGVSPDYFGGLRPGDNKWANSVVALHAKIGEIAWGFQLVHHDL